MQLLAWYTVCMTQIVQFHVAQGQDGYYVATCVQLPVVTQAKNLDELSGNIQEALDLHLEGENLEELGIANPPSILISFELPSKVYA